MQDEADIVEEVGAERDEESGDLLADEKDVLKLGAVDSESVVENRRLESIVNQKRGGVKGVSFNAGDLITKYETIIKYWPANTLDINVKCLTGEPVQHVITSRPRSGAELYQELMKRHGVSDRAKYEVKFFDNNSKEFRGVSSITLPDTRDVAQPQATYAAPWAPPQQQGAPPGWGAPPAPPAAPAPAPVSAPTPPPAPAQDLTAMLTQFRSMFQFFQDLQAQQQPQQAAQPPPPPVMQMPPPPPPGSDPTQMMAWFGQAFDLFKTMLPPPQSAAAATPQQPQAPNPAAAMAVPPMQPPPGMMWVPGLGFVPVDALMRAMGASPPAPEPQVRPGPRGHRPPPFPREEHDEREERGPGYPRAYPPPPPARPRTPADHVRQVVDELRTTVSAAEEIAAILPNGGARGRFAAETPSFDPPEQDSDEDDDSPVRVVDTGHAKVVYGKEDGKIRFLESFAANADKIFKWGGEQIDQINRARAQQAQQQPQLPPQRRVLPPGYVEVGPGYEPPPGFVAVPIEQAPPPPQQRFAPPPEDIPPPIRRTFGMPPDVGEER